MTDPNKKENDATIKALVETLKRFGVPTDRYAISKKAEDRYCLISEKVNTPKPILIWTVYKDVCGNRTEEKSFTSSLSAGFTMIKRLTADDAQRQEMFEVLLAVRRKPIGEDLEV